MRTIRGWIRNLSDGRGPTPGSVGVSATVLADLDGSNELDNSDHGTGVLTRAHIQDGSSDPQIAGVNGHFGWDMELSPGLMNIAVTPSDPQQEHRWRFPDESAQYGKAYLSDLERLGWAGGGDGLVWGAIWNGPAPTAAAWSTDPSDPKSWGSGDWSVAFGPGSMQVTLRRGIAFLGGVPFTVEAGDLVLPVAGEDPVPPNVSGQDRWDLLSIHIITDPGRADYGKQRFVFTLGNPGGGIPADPGQIVGERRLALMALKSASGSGTYSDAFDLRRWVQTVERPGANTLDLTFVTTPTNQVQRLGASREDKVTESVLNTVLAGQEVILPMDSAWAGIATWTGHVKNLSDGHAHVMVNLVTEGRGVSDTLVEGTNYMLSEAIPVANRGGQAVEIIQRIPSYAVSPLQTPARTWHRLRFKVLLTPTNTPIDVIAQRLTVQLRPVT